MGAIPAGHKGIIYLIFSLSGFCALIYEILWTKHLSLTFGTTMIAVSIVAAVFMAGLALGSYLLGKYSDHETNLLRIYAFLELGIAIFALFFPPTLKAVTYVHATLGQLAPGLPGLSHLGQLGFSALLLLPPTVCMGGTFPLMCRFFARKKSGGHIGRLYAMNTVGAALGAFLAGYVLIPQLGLSATNLLAVLINLSIAAVSWQFSRRIGHTVATDVSRATRADQLELARTHRPVLIAIALIGFFSLGYEILWTRVFLLFLGNTSYAFSLMLSSYLIGIALGGALYARLVHPDFDEKKLFVRLVVLMGLSILFTVPFYDRLPHLFQWAHEASGERWWHLSLLSAILVFAVMSVPTIISGALLPAAIAILDPGKVRTGEGVGLVVFHNTAGAVLGSLVAGFLLIPTLGLLGSFRLLAALNLLLAFALSLRYCGGPRRFPAVPLLVVIGLGIALAPVSWNQTLVNSGVYFYAAKYARAGGLTQVLAGERIVEVIEGTDTTVAVFESPDGRERFFTVNGKTDGGTSRDMKTQVLVSHIPMLLHQHPEEVLVIGLGTGISLSGLTRYHDAEVECVEISQEVVEASAHFSAANGQVLDDPAVELIVDDGRNFLLSRENRYDVIISEPSNPWQTGNANLFTTDFYTLAASRLKDQGVFGQWIGLYDITPENFRIAVKTFIHTFPEVMAFRAGTDLILVGAMHPLAFDYLNLQDHMTSPGIRELLQRVGISDPGDLLARHYLCSQESLKRLAGASRLNSDDRPILEYSAHYNIGEKTLGAYQMENMTALMESMGTVPLPLRNLGTDNREIAAALRELGNSYSRAGRTSEARHFFRKAAEMDGVQTPSPLVSSD
jgi:spermidine synthase